MPVRLQKLAAGRVRAERLEHTVCKEAARAVAGIDDDMEAFERMFIVSAFTLERIVSTSPAA
jgi:hypothetical protein